MPRRKKRPATDTSRAKVFFNWIKTVLLRSRSSEERTVDTSNRLKVYLFNVGQGDHILLELPDGKYGIIDFYFEGSVGLKEPPALTFLENRKLQNPEAKIVISFICISHPDSDHVKGVDTFLEWVANNKIQVDNFWLPAGKNFYKLYEQYLIALGKYAKDERQKDRGNDFRDRLKGIQNYLESKAWTGHADDLQGAIRSLGADLGGGTQVVLIAPLTKHIAKFDEQVYRDLFRIIITEGTKTYAQANLMSSILLLIFGKHKLLFGGDTGLDVWTQCLDEFDRTHQQKYFGPCRANFIKVSHHGSKNSSSVELWRRIMGENTYLGISAGRGYRHPDDETLKHARQAAQEIGANMEPVATNTCTACLNAQHIEQESLNELIYPKVSFKPQVAQALNRSKPASFINQGTSTSLGAYIFRFGINDERVRLTKGMFPTTVGHKRCVYDNHQNGPFPACALARDQTSTGSIS